MCRAAVVELVAGVMRTMLPWPNGEPSTAAMAKAKAAAASSDKLSIKQVEYAGHELSCSVKNQLHRAAIEYGNHTKLCKLTLKERRSLLSIGSPMCRMFSRLMQQT